MSNLSLRFVMAALCFVGVTACESPRRRRRPRPRAKAKANTGTVAAEGGRSTSVRLAPGHVSFAFRGADLATEVLPTFQEQAGVTILWNGENRSLTLRLTDPLPWNEALELVCQFTKTHATKDWQGRLVLKDGWHGRATSETLADLTQDGQRGSGSVTSARDQRSQTGLRNSSGGSGSAPAQAGGQPRPNPTPHGQAYSGGAEAKRILQGTNSTQAGGR
jgi:hypothetical protein